MRRSVWILLLVSGLLLAGSWILKVMVDAQAQRVASVNGDTNGDGVRDLSDCVYILNWLFLGGPEPVAIAGSSDLEARVQTLESEVSRLSEASTSPEAMLDKTLARLRALSTGSEDVWSFPLHALKKTSLGGNAPEKATLSLDGAPLGQVLAFKLSEGLSEPPRVDIIQEIPTGAYRPVQPGAPLDLFYQDGSGELVFHGEVVQVAVAGLSSESVFLRIAGFSKLHRLARGRKSHVFQGQTDQDIAQRILVQAGFQPGELELLLGSTRPSREYVVQYRESDFEFLSRLMEEEGIFYFLVHSAEGTRIRLANGPEGWIALPGPPLSYVGPSMDPPAGQGAYISAFHRTRSLVPGKSTVGDYDPATANPVFATASNALGSEEDFRFGVNTFDLRGLTTLAQEELERLQQDADQATGASNAVGLRAGSLIAVGGARGTFDGKYYIVGVRHQYVHTSNGGYYGNTFSANPDSVPFRPRLRCPRPTAQGVQSAIVTGPPGQRIYTDALGRVKVHFFWDRGGAADSTSSPWLRVAQNGPRGATQGYFLPEVGDEVLVAFEHGDIDRPVIVGSLWNGEHRPPQ